MNRKYPKIIKYVLLSACFFVGTLDVAFAQLSRGDLELSVIEGTPIAENVVTMELESRNIDLRRSTVAW
jgi:hypothetical protein